VANATGNSSVVLKKSGTGSAQVLGYNNTLTRWQMQLGNGNTESGGNAGSDFTVARYNDAGAEIDTPLQISRQTGQAFFSNTIGVNGIELGSLSVAGTAALDFHSSGSATDYDARISCSGGSGVGAGAMIIQAASLATPPISTTTTGMHHNMTFPAVVQFGMGISGATFNMEFVDITNSKAVLNVMKWNGSYASIMVPNIGGTAAAANVNVASGLILQVTSSLRYKTDVKPLTKGDADKLLLLEPITYKSKLETDDPHRTWFGFIAEEVAKVEPRLVLYEYLPEDKVNGVPREGATKVPDGLAYDRISVLAVFKAQEQEGRIQAQEDKIATLTAKLDALVARIEALEAAQATP
jgi:hypothetical protein